jgi:hypothetical protein
MRCAHYKNVLIVSHVNLAASAHINHCIGLFCSHGDGRDLFQNLRRTIGRHEPSLFFLMNERLRRLYHYLASDSRVHPKQQPFKEGYESGVQGTFRWSTNEGWQSQKTLKA